MQVLILKTSTIGWCLLITECGLVFYLKTILLVLIEVASCRSSEKRISNQLRQIMYKNIIFSGYGYATGKYLITNKQLEEASRNGYLEGFSEELILSSRNYQKFAKQNPETNPFDYFVGHKMGMKTRVHVSPFPPSKTKMAASETTLDLGVEAIQNALDDSGIHPEDVDAWIVSTVSPHEQAPGIAGTIKCFFVSEANQTQAITITSGCSGFNIGLERAMEFFAAKPDTKNIVVAHTETMSAFLTQKTSFVHLATFGDAAGAVVMSKKEAAQQEGIISINNYQDIKMIDFVGVDKNWNLYMDNSTIKERAVENIIKSGIEILHKANWDSSLLDLIVPHQTGNAILHPCAKHLGVSSDKLYQGVQENMGNISGASVPVSLALLMENNELKPSMKILSPTAGVGGEYGSFAYIVPANEKKKPIDISKDLSGKTALITGITGNLGTEVTFALARRGAKLILQYNSNTEKAKQIETELQKMGVQFELFQCNFIEKEAIDNLIETIKSKYNEIHFLLHTAAVYGRLNRAVDVSDEEVKNVAQINQFMPILITKELQTIVKEKVLYVGSSAEDGQFADSSAYVAAKRGLHGFAASFAAEAFANGIKSIYYMPGIMRDGMSKSLSNRKLYSFMVKLGQAKLLYASDVANRIAKSLYINKIETVKDNYEDTMIVRRDGYKV